MSSTAIAIISAVIASPFLLSASQYINNKVFTKLTFHDWQAIFLNNGTSYFAKITSITSHYVRIENIYYLAQGKIDPKSLEDIDSGGDSVSLIKLGDELHGPADMMLINRNEVTFMENLRPEGQVVRAIHVYEQGV